MSARKRIGVGVIGLGWMGQAHSRSFRRIPMHFPDRTFDPVLSLCSDVVPTRAHEAVASFGFDASTTDWRAVVDSADVDLVVVTAPNAMHVEIIEAAVAAGKDVLCEKPVGRTPEETARAEAASRKAGVITAVGYNYRFAPLVQHARRMIADGELGSITAYRGRFFSMYGNDPLGPLSWRFQLDEGGYGVSTDLLSHSVDLAHFLVGPVEAVVAQLATFITDRPLPGVGGSHYDRGTPGDPTGAVTNEDYVGVLCAFAGGARGSFEACRAFVGPESQMAFEVYGTRGSLAWNLETMNELRVYLQDDGPTNGYRTVYGGDRFPYHGNFVPGNANGIGFEDLIVIEDYELCSAVAERRPHHPGFDDALAYVTVQQAVLRSCNSGQWERVQPLQEDQ
jgi:predicted dehydrogenase